jgi:hypothetical protein
MADPPVVKLTLTVQGRVLRPDEVNDPNISANLKKMASEVAAQLKWVRCPVHGKQPKEVKIHISRTGEGAINYESCCPKLQEAVNKALGQK